MLKGIHHRDIGKLPEGFAPGEIGRRLMSVDKIDKDNRTVELSFSSNAEIKRWGMIEILDHSEGACDLSRLNNGGPLLFNHELDDVLGVIEKAWIDKTSGKGRALVRFSKREEAEACWQDVQDGILRNVSVGYRINDVVLKERSEDGPDKYLVTAWEPYEISIVTAPADTSVGIGRNIQTKPEKPFHMKEKLIAACAARGIALKGDETEDQLLALLGTKPEPAPAQRQIQVGEDNSRGATEERNRVKAILAAGEQYGQRELASKAIQEGKSLDAFRGELLEAVNKQNKQIKDANDPIGLSEREVKGFSFIRLLRALTADPASARAESEAAAFELEACRAAGDKITHRQIKGTMIPTDVILSGMDGKRGTATVSIASGAGYTGTGGNTVATTLLSQSFIETLRNRTVLMQLGSELSGLVGNFDIPRQTTNTTATWIGEDGDSVKTDMDFGLLSLRPKTVAAHTEVTRRMLMQSSLGVEALIRADLARTLALAIDYEGFYGTGSSNKPTGIKATSGINSFNWATANTPLFTEFVRMETEIALDNAEVQNMAYVTNPSVRGYAKGARKIATSTDSTTIWEPGNTINGYRTEITNQIATGDVFFGNFADFILGMWGGLEITTDPYTHSTKGRIRVVTMQDVDYVIRRAASFCYAGNAA